MSLRDRYKVRYKKILKNRAREVKTGREARLRNESIEGSQFDHESVYASYKEMLIPVVRDISMGELPHDLS